MLASLHGSAQRGMCLAAAAGSANEHSCGVKDAAKIAQCSMLHKQPLEKNSGRRLLQTTAGSVRVRCVISTGFQC